MNPIIPDGRNPKLNPWQVVYVAWAVAVEKGIRGHIFADDIGVGKTTSVLSLVRN